MMHALHHVGSRSTETVDFYLDVGMKDFELDVDQRDFIKTAVAAKMSVGMVLREHGGVTLFVCSSAATPADHLSLISAIIATLGPAQAVQVSVEGTSWEKC